MKKREHTEQQQGVRREDLLTWVVQGARVDAYQETRKQVEQGIHPTDDVLHDYVWGMLDQQRNRYIREHLAFCASCARTALRLRVIKQDARAHLLRLANEDDGSTSSVDLLEMPGPAHLLHHIAPEFWEPVGAGEALVAASSSVTQEHEFTTEFGLIKVLCAWGQQSGSEPAFIWLSWDADFQEQHPFQIRLFDPETNETHYTIKPGGIHKGDQTFTQDVLGFDPVGQKWAIAIELPDTHA